MDVHSYFLQLYSVQVLLVINLAVVMFLVLDRGVLAFSGTLHGSLGVVSVGGFWANWQLKSIKGEAPRFIDDDRLFQEGTLCSPLLKA